MRKIAMIMAFLGLLVLPNVSHASGFGLCFTQDIDNVTVVNFMNGVENAVVIEYTRKDQYTMNNYYGTKGLASYWQRGFPFTFKIQGGLCYTFYFMTKTAGPGGAEWACGTPSSAPGPIDAVGVQTTVVKGVYGGLNTAAVLIPGKSTLTPWVEAGCPKGY